jgi:hypothetical protein
MQTKSNAISLGCTFILLILMLGCTTAKYNFPQTTSTLPFPTATRPAFPTLTPSSSATRISIPTLSTSKANERLLEMIKNGIGCNLPCWWGMMPGISTGSDFTSTLSPLIGISQYNYLSASDSGTIDFELQRGEITVFISTRYHALVENGPIRIIDVHTKALKKTGNGFDYQYGTAAYNDLFGKYSMQSMLSSYGRPDQVYLDADIHRFEPSSPTFFYIYLLYAEKGIYARYTTSADETLNGKIQSCPSTATLELWLTPPNEGDSNQQLLTSIDIAWGNPHKPLEEAIGISIDQFYETFKQKSDQCLVTAREIWDP